MLHQPPAIPQEERLKNQIGWLKALYNFKQKKRGRGRKKSNASSSSSSSLPRLEQLDLLRRENKRLKDNKRHKTKAVLIEEILHKYNEQLVLKDKNEEQLLLLKTRTMKKL